MRFAMERADKPLDVREAVLVNHCEDIHEATDRLKGQGMPLVRGECDKEIVGVLTAFDLLVQVGSPSEKVESRVSQRAMIAGSVVFAMEPA